MFRALLLTREDGRTVATLTTLDESQLPPGDVEIAVACSSLNYKDALAVTGRGAIVRRWPMVPGIDLAGHVARGEHPDWPAGTPVVITGWGLGENHWGGLAEKARVDAGWLLRLPEPFTPRTAMAIATAGFTAALATMALQKHGLAPGDGEVLVTGAAGGVGSIAVALLSGLGYRVVASTGRTEQSDYLTLLGATRLIDRAELGEPGGKPLQSERWAGVVDTVGSHTLANACASTRWNGAVAACGLAQGADFPVTVMPFILRGVALYGINSLYTDNATRRVAWDLMARHIRPDQLEATINVIGLDEVIAASDALLAGRVRGRTVVDLRR